MGRSFFICALILLGILFFLFFPVIIEGDVHYDMNRRKFAFCVQLYGFLKLTGGYLTTYKGGVAMHTGNKKAKLIAYRDIQSEGKKFSFVKTFRPISYILTTESGAEYLFLTSIAQIALRMYVFMKGIEKDGIENNLWLTDGDTLRVSAHVVIFFNGYILLKNVLEFIKEKMKLWTRKTKKSTA